MSKMPFRSCFALTGVLCLLLSLYGCTDSEVSPRQLLAFPQPANFPKPQYSFGNNPVTQQGFELGRQLFYDNRLSRDGSVSCGSCHQPYTAFADPVHRLSVGVESRMGIRNAPPIFNLAFQPFFFWDGGVNHLDFVAVNAIENPLEMDETVAEVVRKLNKQPAYRRQFAAVFDKDSIDSQQLLHALSQFMLMLVSANAPYDQFVRHEGYEMTADELSGMQLFRQHCSSCHAGELFTDGRFHNNGLDADFTADQGRMIVTELAEDAGKFKVPSLRNITLTAPYMHDGRFKTLEEVLEHYRSGVQPSATLDPLLIQHNRPGLLLSDTEINQIITFLHTLTDKKFVSDNRFFDPH